MAKVKAPTRRIAILAYPDVQLLDVAGPLQVFASASELAARGERAGPPAYVVEVLAARAGQVRTSSGLGIVASASWREVSGGLDTLLIAGGAGVSAHIEDGELLTWLRSMRSQARRLASVCTGAFLLAAAGLLDGRTATTHWDSAAPFRRLFPRVTLEADRLFVRDGNIWTSAGVTAGMDLALALVEADHDRRLAIDTARHLVMFAKRPGTQSQFGGLLTEQSADHGDFAALCDWIAGNPGADLSVPALAARAGMSERTFARRFLAQTGQPPGRFVARMRLDAARRLLEEGPASVEAVASRAGYGTPEAMRLAFRRRLEVAPRDYRSRFPALRRASATPARTRS